MPQLHFEHKNQGLSGKIWVEEGMYVIVWGGFIKHVTQEFAPAVNAWVWFS